MTEQEVQEPQETAAVEPQPEQAEQETFEQREDRVLLELDGEPDLDDLVPAEQAPDRQEPVEPSEPVLATDEAYAVLRRDGWEQADLEALSAERIQAMAEHRKKMQADIDRKLRERSEPQSVDETDKDSGESQAEPNPDTPNVADLREQVDALADYLGLDDRGREVFDQWQQAAVAPMQKLVEQQVQQVKKLQQQVLYQELERARVSLVGEYPQIADVDSEGWGRVLDRMNAVMQEGTDKRMHEVMEDAVLMEFRDDISRDVKTKRESLRDFKQAGQPDVRPARQVRQEPSTNAEREDMVLRILESDDPDRFQRAKAIGRPNI